MATHYLLPSLNTIIGYEQLSFLKEIKIDQWDLVLCALDYYAKGQDMMYEAYWVSYMHVLNTEIGYPNDGQQIAKKLLNSAVANRATTDAIYFYIRNTFCTLLQQQGISSYQFNNIAGISHGYNYFRVEIMDGTVQ